MNKNTRFSWTWSLGVVVTLVWLALAANALAQDGPRPGENRRFDRPGRTERPSRHRWEAREIRRACDTALAEVQLFQETCNKIDNLPGLPQFLSDLRNFAQQLQRVANDLDRGVEHCSPGFREVKRSMRELESRFRTNFETQPNYRVRLGFYQVQLAFYKVEWEFAEDEMN